MTENGRAEKKEMMGDAHVMKLGTASLPFRGAFASDQQTCRELMALFFASTEYPCSQIPTINS